MNINIKGFIDSLTVMGKGMAGIFIVTVVIIVAIYLLGKINTKDNDN